MRAARTVLLVALLLLLAGCELRTELNVTVEPDGSGRVELALGLDGEAAARRPDLVDELDLAGLAGTGWEVTGPAEEADGYTWVRAGHAFGAPEELHVLVEEVAGEDGPFRDFSLAREDDFAETRYRFEGTVDFTSGLDDMTEDPELVEALGAESRELLDERIGAAIDELVAVKVAVRLPGDVGSNAPTQLSNGAVWRPSVLEREAVALSATGVVRRTERLVWVGVAAAAGFALVLFLLVRVVLWRRRGAAGPPEGGS